MFLGDKYKFYMSFPGIGIREVFPINEEITWSYARGQKHDSFVKNLQTSLIMIDQSNIGATDFTYIYDIERARNRCLSIPVYIDKRCDDQSPFVRYWTGSFTMTNCAFDVEKCKVEVQVQVDDDIRCFLEQWDDDINLVFGGPDFIPASDQTFGELEYSNNCQDVEISPFPKHAFDNESDGLAVAQDCENVGAPGDGWTLFEHGGVFIDPDNQVWSIETTWIREVFPSVTEPLDDNGNPWIEYSPGNWARNPLLTVVSPYVAGNIDPLFPDTWQFYISYRTTALSGVEALALSNGRYLTTMLQYYFDNICDGYSIISNFFGLNPDGTQPANAQYDMAVAKLHELVLHPTHDIVKTDELDASFRIEKFSLKDLLLDLIDTFNLVFFYDPAAMSWRLEHVTYRAAAAMLDLTTDANKKFISGAWAYGYDSISVPKKEVFEFVELTEVPKDRNKQDKNFDGYPIDYAPSDCLNVDSDEEQRNIKIYLTDLLFVMTSHAPVISGAVIQEDSIFYGSTVFVLLSTQAGRIDVARSCVNSSSAGLNITLGWPCLHENWWKQDRYLLTGQMNESLTTFSFLRESRVQVEISLPMCCEDFDSGFQPQDLVKTQLGWGRVEEASYTEPSERLTLTLKHD